MEIELTHRHTPGASVSRTTNGWRMEIPDGARGTYRLAQLDDYSSLPRSHFRYVPPLTLSLRARVSDSNLPGTWGFGLWNDPFGLSFGFGGTAGRLPALPNTAWFFHASPENYLSLQPFRCEEHSDEAIYGLARRLPRRQSTAARNDIPANGFFAGTFRSPRWPSLLLAPGLFTLPLLALRPASRFLRRLASRIIRQDAATVTVDVTQWHKYSLRWMCTSVIFDVDGKEMLKTSSVPRSPLSLVIWVDNQFAAWTPEGRLGYGTLKNQKACLEISNLELIT